MDKLQIPILNTDRLELAPLSMAHQEGMFSLWSNEKVTRYSGRVNDFDGNEIVMPAKKVSDSNLIIDFWLKAAVMGWGFRWALISKESDNCFVGIVGFNSLEKDYEIAFHLLPTFWGKGIMTEASMKAIEWAQERGAETITAFIEPNNLSSIELVQRLGLSPTKEFSNEARKYLRLLS